MNDGIAQDDNIEALLTEAKGIIDQMGELTEADFQSQDDLKSMNDSMVTMVDSLGKIVDGMTVAEAGNQDEQAEEVEYTYDSGFYVNDGSSDAVMCFFQGSDGSNVAYVNDGTNEIFAGYDVAEAELEDGTPYMLVQVGEAVLGYFTDGEDWYIVDGDGNLAAAAELSAEEANAILEAVQQ